MGFRGGKRGSGEIGKGLGGIGLDEGCLVDDGDFARREREISGE